MANKISGLSLTHIELAIKRIETAYANPVIRSRPCDNCPSTYWEPDPEVLEVMRMPHAVRVKTAFICGWSKDEFCRGYCDQMGITQSDLVAAHLGRWGR